MQPDLSIITPWLDHPEFIEDYEKAVRDPGAQVIVVDNGSGPAHAAAIGAMVQRLRGVFIRNDENHWFAAANNQGLAAATGSIVLFMNNDIAAEPGWLDAVRRDALPGRLVGPDVKRVQVDQVYIDYLEGWCIAGRREVWQMLGGWNARSFKMPYWEDTELCLRAMRAGVHLAQTRWPVTHKKNGTSSYVPGVLCGLEHNRQIITSMVRGATPPAEQTARVDPARIETLEAYMRTGRLPEAEHVFRQAVEKEPRRADLWGIYGQVLRACGRFDAAIDAMRRAMELNPSFTPDAQHEMGLSYLNTQRHVQAADAFAQVVRLRPDRIGAWINLAISRCLSGQFTEAAEAAKSAIVLNPRNVEAHVQLSNALLRLGRVEESRAAADAAIQANPNEASGYHALGSVLLAIDQPVEALAALERGQALDPHNWDIHSRIEQIRATLRSRAS